MCRMLGMVSVTTNGAAQAAPLPSWWHLVGAEHSLRIQAKEGCVKDACDPGHADSWGIGWFDAMGRPSLVRQTGSAEDSGYFILASEQAARGENAARTLIGHLRKASCGAVTSENAHPVRVDYRKAGKDPISLYDSLLLAHNGTLRGVLTDTMRPEIVGWEESRSDSDTVVLAGWLGQRLTTGHGTFFATLAQSLRELIQRAGEVAPGADVTRSYTAMNLLIARPEGLYALRQYSDGPEYYTLSARPLTAEEAPEGGWIVASEVTDGAGNWEPLTPGVLSFYSVATNEVVREAVGG